MGGIGGRPSCVVSRKFLCSVIEPIAKEIFKLARSEIIRTDYSQMLTAGVIITGGASQMEGVLELAEKVFNLPVRLGAPTGLTGLTDNIENPSFSTGIGLLKWGIRDTTGVGCSKLLSTFFSKIELMKFTFKSIVFPPKHDKIKKFQRRSFP